ncbi:MAG: hemin receptor [Gammaproteobacteria bacterium]|nr:hemin receptor [Gammaproteobacteria bacterium]
MTPEQKQIVKDTWAAVVPIQEQAAELFYGRLFSEYPEVKPMFKGDMQEQGEKLMKMIDQAVGSLDNLEPLIEPLKAAGKAHKDYGVEKADYSKVGACLLWTLEQGLGEAYNPSVQDAWGETYGTLSSVMIEGAEYDVPVLTKPVQKKSWIKSMFAKA